MLLRLERARKMTNKKSNATVMRCFSSWCCVDRLTSFDRTLHDIFFIILKMKDANNLKGCAHRLCQARGRLVGARQRHLLTRSRTAFCRPSALLQLALITTKASKDFRVHFHRIQVPSPTSWCSTRYDTTTENDRRSMLLRLLRQNFTR